MIQNKDEYICALQEHHANQLELARLVGEGAATIMGIKNDPEIVAAAEAMSAATGEPVRAIVDRVIEKKRDEYLAQHATKNAPSAPQVANKAVEDFRAKMGAKK